MEKERRRRLEWEKEREKREKEREEEREDVPWTTRTDRMGLLEAESNLTPEYSARITRRCDDVRARASRHSQ